MNMFKKNGGFTLVELIVVIAILAILAGIAIPAYTGYIAKANEAADLQQLGAIKTAVFFVMMDEKDGADAKIESIEVKGGAVYVDGSTTATDVSAYCNVPTTFKSGAESAVWSVDENGIAKWDLKYAAKSGT